MSKRWIASIILMIVFFAFTSRGSLARASTWRLTGGPYGAWVREIVALPSDHVIAWTSSGFYRSANNGDDWSSIVDPLLEDVQKAALATSPSGDVLLATSRVLLRSRDKGLSWKIASGMFPIEVSPSGIAVDSKGNIYITTWGSGVLRSADNGSTWEKLVVGGYYEGIVIGPSHQVYTPGFGGVLRIGSGDVDRDRLSTDYHVETLAFNSEGHALIGRDGGVFLSKDDGDNWLPVNSGLPEDCWCTDLVVAPEGVVFAATLDGIYRSNTFGTTWMRTSEGLPYGSYRIDGMVVSPTGDVFVGTTTGAFRLDHGTERWISVNRGLGRVLAVHTLVAGPGGDILVAAESHMVCRMSDDGNAWSTLIAKTPVGSRCPLVILAGGTILAGAADGGILQSNDNGDTWKQLGSDILAGVLVEDLATDGQGTLYSVTFDGRVFRSTDHGVSWVDIGSDLPVSEGLVRRLAASDSCVYLSLWENGLYRSRVGEWMWSRCGALEYVRGLTLCDNGQVLAGSSGQLPGVFCSADNGKEWTAANSGLMGSGLGSSPEITSFATRTDGQIALTSYWGFVFISDDMGENWECIKTDLGVSCMAVAFDQKGSLYVGGIDGVWQCSFR
jgi:photosystem II stability/assembly factor-like uncharacterized protein